ncbi:MAG: hypothetical protein GY708_01480 [Actinomycetia bacterium]|nr:hypothetical protein [Actinomycetes bacterium]
MVSTDEVLDGANELFSQMQPVADEPRLLAEAMGTHELRTLVFHLSRGRDIAALARKIACERARRGA